MCCSAGTVSQIKRWDCIETMRAPAPHAEYCRKVKRDLVNYIKKRHDTGRIQISDADKINTY